MEDDSNLMDIDPEIAAAMGFSSFGNQRPPHKRKQEGRQPSSSASGANSTKLGTRNVQAVETPTSAITNAANAVDPAAAGAEPSAKREKTGGQQNQALGGGLAGFLSRGQELKYDQAVSGGSSIMSSTAPLNNASVSSPRFPGIIVGKKLEDLTREELDTLRRGVRDEQGNMAYFLPSFIEDPWAGLP